jgi:hypothetical protein
MLLKHLEGARGMKISRVLILLALAAVSQAQPSVDARSAERARAEVAPLLAQMGAAANRHDVEGHVGFYARDPAVTLIVDGTPLIGWETIREKQREWWKNGDTDVVYTVLGKPDFQVPAPNVVISTKRHG